VCDLISGFRVEEEIGEGFYDLPPHRTPSKDSRTTTAVDNSCTETIRFVPSPVVGLAIHSIMNYEDPIFKVYIPIVSSLCLGSVPSC